MHILDLPVPAPLVSSPTWEIVDSTKLSTLRECPRKYFYEYVLGWRSETPNLHFIFGSAWHAAMEHYYQNLPVTSIVINEAFERFLSVYREVYSEFYDAANAPKNPETALLCLMAYANYYPVENFEVLYTEVAGSVPVDEATLLHFKIDTIVRGPEGIYSLEHKTTGFESNTWQKQWLLSPQMSAYAHALYCHYGDEVYGVKVNGAIFRKSKGPGFIRVPVRKTAEQLSVWLYTTQYYLRMLKWYHDQLASASDDDEVLCAFPMNEHSCTGFGVCFYHSYCNAWPNPLRRCASPPMGMVTEHWNPRAAQDTANYVYTPEKEIVSADMLKEKADEEKD